MGITLRTVFRAILKREFTNIEHKGRIFNLFASPAILDCIAHPTNQPPLHFHCKFVYVSPGRDKFKTQIDLYSLVEYEITVKMAGAIKRSRVLYYRFIEVEISCINCKNLGPDNFCKSKKQKVLYPELTTCRQRSIKPEVS